MPRLTHRLRVALLLFVVGWGANHFAALLLVYRETGQSTASVTAMLAAYIVGLIPALLVAGRLSDRIGRSPVMWPAVGLTLLASLILMAGSLAPWLLYPGRVLAGVATGTAMASGTPWVRELSTHLPRGAGARLAAVALSAGFGGGPLVSGAVAQWLPAPRTTPYLVHLALLAVVVLLARGAHEPERSLPETSMSAGGPTAPRVILTRPFVLGVGLWAPWVFGVVTISFGTVPNLAQVAAGPAPVLLAGGVAAVTLLTGVYLQPLARRLNERSGTTATVVGLAAAAAGLALAATAAGWDGVLAWWQVLPIAFVLGCAYALLLVSGLVEVEHLVPPAQHGRVVSVYYGLTYLGFVLPWVLTLLDDLGIAALSTSLAVAALGALLTIPVKLMVGHTVPGDD